MLSLNRKVLDKQQSVIFIKINKDKTSGQKIFGPLVAFPVVFLRHKFYFLDIHYDVNEVENL